MNMDLGECHACGDAIDACSSSWKQRASCKAPCRPEVASQRAHHSRLRVERSKVVIDLSKYHGA
jgi:hypothetical protein